MSEKFLNLMKNIYIYSHIQETNFNYDKLKDNHTYKHHIQTYSLYETYGDTSKDCTITREQKPWWLTCLECYIDGHCCELKGKLGPRQESRKHGFNGWSAASWPSHSQRSPSWKHNHHHGGWRFRWGCRGQGYERVLQPKGCVSPASLCFTVHIPGEDLPLFRCPLLAEPAATWPSGAHKPKVQVEGPEWPLDGNVREGEGDRPHGERKCSLTLCSQPFNQQHFGRKKADWPQSWKHLWGAGMSAAIPHTLCGTSPYTSMGRLGEKFLLPGGPYPWEKYLQSRFPNAPCPSPGWPCSPELLPHELAWGKAN